MVVGLFVGGALGAGLARLIGTSFLLPGGVFVALTINLRRTNSEEDTD